MRFKGIIYSLEWSQVLIGAWLNAAGAAVRILSGIKQVPVSTKFTVVMIGQTLAALAQPFLLGSPTKLAALWFGANERATANMVASLSEFTLISISL